MIADTLNKMLLRVMTAYNEIQDEYKDCPQHHEDQAVKKFRKVLEEVVDEYKKG